MSYAYSTRMPKTLRQPITLAILGSLGIHGLLWAILPILPLAPKPSAVQQQPTVGLVELTPAEQERLPQLTPSPADNKQVNSQPTLPESSLPPPLPPESSVLPPLPPPLPPESSVLPPLPPLPYTASSVPPSITYPPIANLKPRLAVPPPPPSSLLSSSTLPKQQDVKSSPLPTNLSRIPVPKLPHREPLPSSFSPPANTGLPSLAGIKPAPFSPPPATALNPPSQRNNQSQNQHAVASPESATPTPPENSSNRSRQELLADLEQYRRNIDRRELLADLKKYQAQSERTTTATTRKETLTNEQQQLAAQQHPNPTAPDGSEQTTPLPGNPASSMSLAERDAQIADYAIWRNKIKQQQPESARQILETMNVCQKQLDGSIAKAEVLVNPQGKIAEGPEILGQITPSVKQYTEEFLRKYQFSKTEKFTIYPFDITYKYSPSSCSEANLKPTTDQTTTRPLANPNFNNSQPTTDQTTTRQPTPKLLRSTFRRRRLRRLR